MLGLCWTKWIGRKQVGRKVGLPSQPTPYPVIFGNEYPYIFSNATFGFNKIRQSADTNSLEPLSICLTNIK